MGAIPSVGRLLWQPLGGWRAQVVWRAFGWGLHQLALQMIGHKSYDSYLAALPWEYHAMVVCGLLLVALGPRLIVLLATAVSASLFLVTVTLGTERKLAFIADEYLLDAGLPVLALVVFAIVWIQGRKQSDSEQLNRTLDEAQMALFRIVLLCALGFAAFHKLNADFLDPSVSCMNLARRLERSWPFAADLIGALGPVHFLVLEAAAPILLVVLPRVGVPTTILVVLGLGHIGPTAFASLVIALSFSFYREDDLETILGWMRRYWGILLAGFLVLSGASLRLYAGQRPWLMFFDLQLLAGAAAIAALVVLWTDIRGGRKPWAFRLPPRPWIYGQGPLRSFFGYLMFFAVLNGLSPYVGVKFRYSFAMLSNLRADDARWNSLVVPSFVHLAEHDAYVHVTHVEPPPKNQNERKAPVLRRGVFSPAEFRRRVRSSQRRGQQASIELTYGGETRVFENAGRDIQLQRWADALPSGRLLQGGLLTIDEPQHCVH